MDMRTLGAALLAAVFTGPALAADIPVKAPVRAAAFMPVFSWTGLYGGVHGGYGWGDADYTFPIGAGFGGMLAPVAGGALGKSIDGGVFGGHVGYNYQIGNWVLGVEGSFTWSGLKGTASNVFAPTVPANAIYSTDLEWFAAVTRRLGYARDNWLVYVKGGLAAGRVDSRLVSSFFPLTYREKEDHVGWTLGAGVEYAWTPNWIVGIEYNYYDLGDQKYGSHSYVTGGVVSGQYHLDLTFSTVTARLSYKWEQAAAGPYGKQVVAPAGVWSGLYLGVHGGYGWGDADYSFGAPTVGTFGPVGLGIAAAFGQSVDGGLVGVHGGYNHQVGSWVFGLESTIAWSGIEGSSVNPLAALGIAPTETYETEIKSIATFTPRLGMAWNQWHVYGKGGLVAARVEAHATDTSVAPTRVFSEKNDHIGWTLGAGIEAMLTPNWFVGVEYNYYDLGRQRYGGVSTTTLAQYDIDLTFSSVLARVSYKFSGR